MRDGYKQDTIFASIGLLFMIVSVPMIFMGIWLDPRWFATALVSFCLGVACGMVSTQIDKRYRERGIRK